MTADPHASASELTAALRARQIGSRELLELYLDRVERLNPPLNAVVTLDAERALAEAAAADEAIARGEPLGPLHGLPITVKDTIETVGLRTTAGAAPLASHVPASDATAVARLRAAGAIVFGKTNTPPWASEPFTDNPLFGRTSNPWDRERTPGCSSGGSAAAVAAGLTGLDLGSDLGGSLRMPAAYCGLYTLRPSHGVVPSRGHIPPPPGFHAEVDMGTLGPLARGADDLGLILDVLAGSDGRRGGFRCRRRDPASGWPSGSTTRSARCPTTCERCWTTSRRRSVRMLSSRPAWKTGGRSSSNWPNRPWPRPFRRRTSTRSSGWRRDGLPVGMQVIGPYLEDRTVVDAACRIAEVLGPRPIPAGY